MSPATALSPNEIELGKLAIGRGLATREQVRECAELRATGNSEHLAKLLVTRGYMQADAARALYHEVAKSGGSAAGVGSNYGTGSNPGSAPGSALGSGFAPPAAGTGVGPIPLICPACGVRNMAQAAQAGQQIRCSACAGVISVPGNARGGNGSNYGSGFGGPGSRFGPGNTQVVPPQHAPGGRPATQPTHINETRGFPAGSNYGPAPTPAGSNFGPPGSNYGPPGSNYGVAGSGFGQQQPGSAPGGPSNFAAGSNFGPQPGSNFGAAGSNFGAAGSNFGKGSAFGAQGQTALPSNIASDDPIAHAMSTRQNADGSTETVFGPYDILGEIARGGMGIVYRARQRSLKRIVALKVMKEGENASEKQIRRFKRETEAAAKLQHPNIVAVHEVGCHEGFHYFTMDLIEGDPLDAIVKRKEKMPVRKVLDAVKEVAQAIHYAHGKGIIHRDLKPANVLLDTDGHPKVTDFGLAKQIDHKSMLTRTGAVVGTPFYMPPEQAKGDVDIDQRADVYALGVILYELLTLKLPFHGETTMEVYHKILEEEPLPPRKHDSRIDKDVNTIVLKAMEKDVARRYQTAQELAEDIQRYMNGDPIKARPLGPIGRAIKKAKKNLPVVVVGSVTFLALIGSLALIYWRNQQAIAMEREINRNHEWETFLTEVENQCINARSQITSGIARQKDKDPQGALADLEEAERILNELPLLADDFTTWNKRARTEEFLGEKQPEINKIYQEIYLQTGRAHALKATGPGYKKALGYFKQGLEKCASETTAGALRLRLEVGRVRAMEGKFADALKVFQDILKVDRKHVDARLEMGLVHDRAGDHPKAIECFSDVIERDSKVIRAYLLRGATYYTLARHESALADFEKVLELQEDLFEGYIWRGRTHQALGHFGEAQDDLTEAIDITPSLPDGYYFRAELHFAQRKLAQAIKDYEVAISRSAQCYKAYLGLGRALEWVLDYERAGQQYDEILQSEDREAKPVKAKARAALARLNLVQADPHECKLEVEEKIRQKTATPDGALGPSPPLDILLKEASVLRKQRLNTAREGFEQALQADPNLIEALLGRASLALREGSIEKAKSGLSKALEVLAQRPRVRFKAGGQSEEDDDDDDDEWEDDEDGEKKGSGKVDRHLSDVRVLLGDTALAGKDLDKAEQHYKKALSADSGSAAAKAGLGHVLLARNKRDAAMKLFKEARLLGVNKSGEGGYFHSEGKRFTGLATRSKKPEYFKQARQAFARSLARNSRHALACLERAKLTAQWGAFDVAVDLARKAVKADPFLREAYELLGFLFTRDLPAAANTKTKRPRNLRDHVRGEREFDKAIKVARSVRESADAHYGRALALLAQAKSKSDPRMARAKKDLEHAIKAVPTDFNEAEPREINQAIAYLEKYSEVNKRLGDAEGAATALKRVEFVKKAAMKAAEEQLKKGQTLRDRLNYSEAIKRFDRAIELNPKFDKAYYDRGTCYLKIGNFVPGILDFSRALELNPRIADQVYNKVYQISYVVDLNRVITELNKIVSDHPNVSYVVFLRGFFYVAKTEFKQVSREDLELGIADFDRCLALNPKHVTALLYRGFLWMKMASKSTEPKKRIECYDRALKNYKQALVMDPVSGISHYLQALLHSTMSVEEGIDEKEAARRRTMALKELKESFKCEFKGYERIRNEKGFDPIRNLDEFKKLMRGK